MYKKNHLDAIVEVSFVNSQCKYDNIDNSGLNLKNQIMDIFEKD